MARIRTIKPDFWMNEDVAEWSRDTRLVFLGLLTYCQDHGVGSANVRRLASQILPMDDPAEASTIIRRALDECSRTGQIVLFEHEGRALYWVREFSKHQRVDRPGKCSYPLPTLAQIHDVGQAAVPSTSEDGEQLVLVEDSTNVRRTLVPVVEEEWSGKDEQKNVPSTADAADPQPAPRDDVEALCVRLLERLNENDYKPRPVITKAWRDDARRLIDIDERNLDQALRLIDWCQQDGFWSTNIASMSKFRKQYPKLLAAAKREHAAQQRSATPRVSPHAQRLQASAALIASLAEAEAAEARSTIRRSIEA